MLRFVLNTHHVLADVLQYILCVSLADLQQIEKNSVNQLHQHLFFVCSSFRLFVDVMTIFGRVPIYDKISG